MASYEITLNSIHKCGPFCLNERIAGAKKCHQSGKIQPEIVSVSYYDPKNAKKTTGLRDLSEIVIEDKEIKIKFDYPLNKPLNMIFKTKNPTGFTRKKILDKICLTYQRIYNEEDESTQIQPNNIPDSFNRNKTNGKYGIWGHDISDLVIERLTYNPLEKRVILDIGS